MNDLLKRRFEELRDEGRNGVNSVQLEKLLKGLGYRITRKSIDALAKAGVIKKPCEVNYAKGKGRRVEYDIESVIDILIYCIICDVIHGIGKGMAVFDKHLLVAEAKKIAEVGDSDLNAFVAYAHIAALISAKNIIPSRITIAQRISCAANIRELLYRVAVLYRFLANWLKLCEGDVLEDWRVLRKKFITSKNIKNFYKNSVKQMLTANSEENASQAIEESLRMFKKSDEAERKDLIAWCELITVFNNSNGFVGNLARNYMENRHGLKVFGTSADWILAFNIMRCQ